MICMQRFACGDLLQQTCLIGHPIKKQVYWTLREWLLELEIFIVYFYALILLRKFRCKIVEKQKRL